MLDQSAWVDEDARTVSIPAGDYVATLYCYASAPNGRWCLDEAGPGEPLGAWFRRSHPGQEFPDWLHNFCLHDPSLDPGRNAYWKRAKEKLGSPVVDLLLHLEKACESPTGPSLHIEGVFRAGECRRPDPFPLGLAASISGLAHEEGSGTPSAGHAAAGAASTAQCSVIPGGPVAVPLGKLFRVAHLAWLCQPYVQPALHITFPGKPPMLEEIEDANVRIEGNRIEVTFTDDGQPSGALRPLEGVARQLAMAPDGTQVELWTSRARTRDAKGIHRYRGPVQGGGWQITEAAPSVEASIMVEALGLAEALENARKLSVRNEAEAARIEARVMKVLAEYFGSNGLQRTGTEVSLKRRDPNLFPHIVARVFWMRYGGVWPLQDEDQVA